MNESELSAEEAHVKPRGSLLVVALLTLLATLTAQAQLPQTLDEMKAQHVLLATTPEGAVEAFFGACFVYMNPATRDAGREMLQYLALPLKGEASWDRLPSQRLFTQYLVDVDRQHVWRSYAKGATPENGYRINPNDWELDVEATRLAEDEDRGLQVHVNSSGADAPRVVYVKQDRESGLWYVSDWDELLEDVRSPMSAR